MDLGRKRGTGGNLTRIRHLFLVLTFAGKAGGSPPPLTPAFYCDKILDAGTSVKGPAPFHLAVSQHTETTLAPAMDRTGKCGDFVAPFSGLLVFLPNRQPRKPTGWLTTILP